MCLWQEIRYFIGVYWQEVEIPSFAKKHIFVAVGLTTTGRRLIDAISTINNSN